MLVDNVMNMMRRVVTREAFTDVDRREMLVGLVVMVIYVVLLLLVGVWLYNNVLCKTLTVVKPLPNVWHLLGLVVLLDLMLPKCMCNRM